MPPLPAAMNDQESSLPVRVLRFQPRNRLVTPSMLSHGIEYIYPTKCDTKRLLFLHLAPRETKLMCLSTYMCISLYICQYMYHIVVRCCIEATLKHSCLLLQFVRCVDPMCNARGYSESSPPSRLPRPWKGRRRGGLNNAAAARRGRRAGARARSAWLRLKMAARRKPKQWSSRSRPMRPSLSTLPEAWMMASHWPPAVWWHLPSAHDTASATAC